MIVACISASRVPSTTANSMQVMKACQAISQLGHEVHLVLPKHKSQLKNINLASFYGLTTEFPIDFLPSQPKLNRYDFAIWSVRKARQIKADLAYIWFVQAGILSLLAHLPVIFELHGPPEGKFGPALFRLFQKIPGNKRLLPITTALAGQLQAGFGIELNNPHLVRTAPNGVDLERYVNLPDPAAARAVLGLPEALTVGYTGHLYPGRGMNILMELARCFPRLNFLWVGGRQQDIDAWKKHLADENINNITLTGFIDNSQLPFYQAAADILLMPYERVITGSSGGNSTSYASPMKMFEYMACRRAIISSDLPVIREVLNPSNSMLCPPEDIDVWSQALGNLIYDEERRQKLAEQAWMDIQQYT
ncbi:MAG TPA: glycosyltransferase, partial [Anaerolineales bacterium]|nr:glycosyltransferase [Anaerolineales bacterium]